MCSGLDRPLLDCGAPSLGQSGLEVLVNEATFISRSRNPRRSSDSASDCFSGAVEADLQYRPKADLWLH